MEPAQITAGSLHLRPFEPADAAEMRRACSDPEVQRWTSIPLDFTLEQARDYCGPSTAYGWASGRVMSFAVLDSVTGGLLAGVQLERYVFADLTASLGYWCAPWARGRGVATQACRSVCRWGFAVMELGLIEWRCEVGNEPSRRVAERLGFTVEGVLRQRLVHRDQRVDCWVGSVLPAELS